MNTQRDTGEHGTMNFPITINSFKVVVLQGIFMLHAKQLH